MRNILIYLIRHDALVSIFLTLFLLVLLEPLEAQLTKKEKDIAQYVKKREQEAIKLLEQAVNINSGTMNFDGVYKVGQLFRRKFDELGFATRWVDGQPFGRSGHLFATHKGKGKTILLIGHLDTVFEPSSPFQKFEHLNDTTIKGPGVGDMKGGDIVIIYALQALKDAGLLHEMDIIVALIGDEELSGNPLHLARHDLIEAAKKADIAIGFEDGDGNPKTAVIARRGSSGWTLTTKGKPAHSSQIFTKDVGVGAIFEASRIMNEFYRVLSKEKNLTFNPGTFIAGSDVERDDILKGGKAYGKNNIVAKTAIVTGDLRAVSPEQLYKARKIMKDIASNSLPHTQSQITFHDGIPPLPPTKGNYKLLSMLDKVSKDLGIGPVGPVNPRNAGAADISHTSPYVPMALDGMGLGSEGGHTIHETADTRTIRTQTQRAAILLHRISRKL